METTLQKITPEMARTLLSKNSVNRPINRGNVESLKTQILKNKWTITHQGICISKSGSVIDGRHRLTACVETKKPISVMVTVNAPDEIFKFIDVGRSRKPSDILAIEGFLYYNEMASIAGNILKYEKGALNNAISKYNILIDDVIKVCKDNEEAFYEIIKAEKRHHSVLVSRHMSIFIYWLLQNEISEDLVEDFWYPMATGLTTNQYITKYREELMNNKLRKLSYSTDAFVCKALHYARCFINNKPHRFQDTASIKDYVGIINSEM